MAVDVLVIGAGLAGLNAARTLEAAGREVLLLEAGDGIGGRVRTDLVDGFRLDRGFQVLNPAYPAVREAVPVERLALRPFGRGVVVRGETGPKLLVDPRQRPGRAGELLQAARADWRGAVALAKWLAPALAGRGALAKGADATLTDSLDAAGVHGPLRDQVLEPFLAGVLADDRGMTSAAFTRWLLRWFLLGTPGLPAQGMAALPALLRSQVRAEVRLDTPVTGLRRAGAGWHAETTGGRHHAQQVVLAAGPATAARLAGRPAPQLRGLATWWFAPRVPPTDSTYLHVDGLRRGPVVNTAVVSNAQPSYAPAGGHLVQASTLLGAGRPSEAAVREHIGEIYGASAADWPLLAVHRIPEALPAVGPGLWQRPQVAELGLVIAGDTADASIQGALQSGRDDAGLLLARG